MLKGQKDSKSPRRALEGSGGLRSSKNGLKNVFLPFFKSLQDLERPERFLKKSLQGTRVDRAKVQKCQNL